MKRCIFDSMLATYENGTDPAYFFGSKHTVKYGSSDG